VANTTSAAGHIAGCSVVATSLVVVACEAVVVASADPDFAHLFRQRNDAESINRALEDTMFLRRAHSVGHRRQLVNLLGYALMVNSLTLHRYRRPARHLAAAA
jgi:hypothetical protein